MEEKLSDCVIKIVTNEFENLCDVSSIVYEKESRDNFKVNDLITEALRISDAVIHIESVGNINATSVKVKVCSVIIIDTFYSFLKLSKKLSPNFFSFSGYYAIILLDGKIDEIDQIFNLLWKKQIYNIIMSYIEHSKLKTLILKPFNLNCHNPVPIVIKENVVKLFDLSLRNLQGCPLKVSTPLAAPYIMINSDNLPIGREIALMKTLSEALNFTLDLKVSNHSLLYGKVYENGTSTGVIRDLLQGKADIILGDYFLKLSRLAYSDASKSYFSSKIVIVVPPGRHLKPIEKLLQPFKKNVWIGLGLSLFTIIGVITIFQVKYRNAVMIAFERRSPIISLLSLMFGISQAKSPQRNFSRLLTISCLIFFIVLQAIYQGSLYKFLQSESKIKELNSLEEIIENRLEFYVTDAVDDFIKHNPIILQR